MTSTGIPASEPGPAGTGEHQPAIEVLLPPELALDELSRRRLVERLAASPSEVTAVAAPLRALAPGSSTVVQAEWAAVEATNHGRPAVPSPDRVVTAAVAVRAGVAHTVDRRAVTIDQGTILVDPGACTSDPFAPAAPIEPAGATARPPFRCRPVVLFLEGTGAGAPTEAVRDLVNGLVTHEVEARLATERPIEGPHLTRICSPTETSWRALQPDVAVLGDEAAFGWATSWCDQRGTVFIALDPALGPSIELVSWTIGQAQGRLRARIGPHVAPGDLARLVNRLCAGPQPEPPVDRPGSPVAAPTRGPGRSADVDERYLGGLDDQPDDDQPDDGQADEELDDELPVVARPGRMHRVAVTETTHAGSGSAARLDQLDGAGHQVHRLDLRADAPPTDDPADVLIVDPGTDPADLAAWRARGGSGTAVVVDLTGATDGGATDGLARAAGAVLVERPDQLATWRARGVRAQVATVLLTRARTHELRAAAARRLDPAAPILGWHLDPMATSGTGADEGEIRQAVVAALGHFLEAQPEARLEVVGTPPTGPLDHHPRVVVRASPPDPGQLAGWTAQIWSAGTSAPAGPAVLEAGFAGVPTVTATWTDGAEQELIVASPTDERAWLVALEALIEDRARRRWSARARAWAEGLRGRDASRAAIERFLGWATAASDIGGPR